MAYKKLLMVYESLHDEANELANEHGIDISIYAGRSACLLNQASHTGLRAGSQLFINDQVYMLPRLASSYRPTNDDEIFFETEFADEELWQDFSQYAEQQGIPCHERMNRALRLSNFILTRSEPGTQLTFYEPSTEATLHTVM